MSDAVLTPWRSGSFSLAQLSSKYPWYTDALTGAKVYKLTSSVDTPSQTFKYETFYYHIPCFPAAAGKVVVRRLYQGWIPNWVLLDLSTGTEKVLFTDGAANPVAVKGNDLYYGSGSSKISRMNLDSLTSDDLYDLGRPGIQGALSVNADNTKLLVQQKDATGVSNQFVLVDIKTKTHRLLWEGVAAYEHNDFSFTMPDIFSMVNQSADPANKLDRVLLGDAGTGELTPLRVLDPAFNAGQVGHLAHPFWDYKGQLLSDSLWNSASGPGLFRYYAFGIGHKPLAAWNFSHSSSYATQWNIHPMAAGADYPNWYVGSGGHSQYTGEKVINVFRMTPAGMIERYAVGQLTGDEYPSPGPSAWMLPSGDGLIVAMGHYSAHNPSVFIGDVYLFEIPQSVQAHMKQNP